MIGKKLSFDVIPKNSERWSWGDVRHKTVPEAATGQWKRKLMCVLWFTEVAKLLH